ncbi:hypothetical protein RYX36_004651 [Vicia faba]
MHNEDVIDSYSRLRTLKKMNIENIFTILCHRVECKTNHHKPAVVAEYRVGYEPHLPPSLSDCRTHNPLIQTPKFNNYYSIPKSTYNDIMRKEFYLYIKIQ